MDTKRSSNVQKWNSRKLIMFGALLTLGTGVWVYADGSFDQWTQYTKWLFGIYVVGNTASKATRKIKVTNDE